MATIEETKKLARELVDAYCAGDAGWARELLADGFFWRLSGAPNVMGRDEWLRGLEDDQKEHAA